MVEVVSGLRLAGYAVGAVGAALLFLEFFQLPSYVEYQPEFDSWNVEMAPMDVDQYSWLGRIGALLLALAFGLLFLATFLE